MADRSITYQLIEARFQERGQDFATYIAEQRTARVSWRSISQDIRERAGVKVSSEMLRRWFNDQLAVVLRPAAEVSA